MIKSSKVTIHMVSSLDGFIAKADGSVNWMHSTDHYEKGIQLSDSDIENFLNSIDCYVMGAKTYEQALNLGWPYGATPVVVLTHRSLPNTRDHVQFFSGDLVQLVNDKLKPQYTNIWMVGGAMLTKAFIRAQLADEIIISILPIILGSGIAFFDQVGVEQGLHLKDVKAYQDGMVEMCYEIIKK